MNAVKQAAKILGSQRELARLMGITPGAVSQWIASGVPVEHCPRIERLTGGVVRCEAMRPEVDWAYLRATDRQASNGIQEGAKPLRDAA